VTFEALDQWGESRIQDGMSFTTVAANKNQFWRLLQQAGWTTLNPPRLMRHEKYGVPVDQLAPKLKTEIEALLKWKQAEFAPDRPQRGKIRAVSANNLRLTICQLAGYVINICDVQPATFTELVQKQHVEGFVAWLINDRGVMGRSIQPRIGALAAVLNHHPSYASEDYSWLKRLIDSIPIEDYSETKKRKATKYVEYEVLETIPGKIYAAREAAGKKTKQKRFAGVAWLAMEELMMRWLLILPWRERNIIECRIGGRVPNLFKSKIPPFSELDIPAWVIEEAAKNPNAEYWQFQFSVKETKTGIPVHALLPRHLIEPLEEYLTDYRPNLLKGQATVNLFVNHAGKRMKADHVGKIVGNWSLRCGGVRTTPHLFRDSVAFKWLKEHPKDYLTLSKMLWHKNVQTTIGIYGSRFNESSGVCAMEAWLDERIDRIK
jgi:integrase